MEGETATVFVGNLSWGTTNEDLQRFMSQAGVLVSAEVQCHADSGRSKGWGLVTYSDPAEARNAISLLANVELDGRAVHIRLDRSKMDTSGGFPVFVGNLPWSTTDEELAELFSEYRPYDAHVKTNMAGRSRGFAILRFASPEAGRRAIAEMNNLQIKGRPIQVREDREGEGGGGSGGGGGGAQASAAAAAAAAPEIVSCVVFAGNLAWGTTDDDLFRHFSTVPGLVSAKLQVTPNGRSKGWGLVTYETPQQAEEAIAALNNSLLHERHLNVRLDRK